MNKELIDKSTQDFISIYKSNLHIAGIKADSSAEKMMLNILINSAKQWTRNAQYDKTFFSRKK